MALKELVSARLREARRLKGWTQAQAADSIHVKQTTWASWESGQNTIPLEMLEYAARELEQPIEFFVVANYQYTVNASRPGVFSVNEPRAAYPPKKERTARRGVKQDARK